MNLLADEGVGKQIVVRLREEGYSVSYVAVAPRKARRILQGESPCREENQ